jgi:hypothetical protein
MIRAISKRGLIAAVVLATAALVSSALPASADTGPDGFPILYADSYDVVHDCEVIGSYAATDDQAVICVDIDTSGAGDYYYATGEVEAYCEHDDDASDLVGCDYIGVGGIFANQSHGAYTGTLICDGDCSAQRYILDIDTFDYTNTDCTTATSNDIWAEATSDTQIWTPGGGEFFVDVTGNYNDDFNYSTGHYWVCP